MDRFQSLRCLWQRLDKTVQSIMLKLGMYGYLWIYMGIYGYVWVYMCMYGYIQVYRYCQMKFNVSKGLSFGAWFIEGLTPQLVISILKQCRTLFTKCLYMDQKYRKFWNYQLVQIQKNYRKHKKNPESKAASYYKDIQDQCNEEPIPLSPSKI